MPVLEQLSEEYAGDVSFLAVGARGDAGTTAARAGEWMPSGRIKWAYDPNEEMWQFFAARGTPTTVLVSADEMVLGGWPGATGEENLRQALDQLIAVGS